ncbi:class I SAM-dependent methyltransferase [Chloroflexota bacterium]
MPLTLDRQNAYRARYADLHPGWRPATVVYEALVRAALALDQRPTLLDMGCGRGGVLEQLAEPVNELTGVDHWPIGIDPDFDSLREHRLLDLTRAVALADAIPLQAASVDVAISAWVLEHLPDPVRTFREVGRVLRPGGAFVFLAPNKNSPAALVNRVLHPLQDVLVPLLYGRAEADTFPVVYRANTRSQIAGLAEAAGLTLETFHAIDDPTYFAFNEPLFWLSRQVTRLLPASQAVHIVGVCRKPPQGDSHPALSAQNDRQATMDASKRFTKRNGA